MDGRAWQAGTPWAVQQGIFGRVSGSDLEEVLRSVSLSRHKPQNRWPMSEGTPELWGRDRGTYHVCHRA